MQIACLLDSIADYSLADVLDCVGQSGFRALTFDLPIRSASSREGGPPATPDAIDHLRHEISTRHLAVAAIRLRRGVSEIQSLPDDAGAVLATASKLGAKTLMLPAVVPTESEHWNEWRGSLIQLGDRAANNDMTISLDFRDVAYSDSRAMLEAVGSVAHPAIGVSFDTGRYQRDNPTSNDEIALQRVCGHLSHLGLSDYSSGSSGEEFPVLGEAGGVDFARTLQIAGNVGFEGPCTVSMRPQNANQASLSSWRRRLEASLVHLRNCGWPVGP